MMFVKMICKEKDINTKKDEKQAEALNKEFYVIDPSILRQVPEAGT